MTQDERNELKELIRSEPGISDTFRTVDAEYTSAMTYANSLAAKRDELLAKLEAIESAKEKIASEFSDENKGESVPVETDSQTQEEGTEQ